MGSSKGNSGGAQGKSSSLREGWCSPVTESGELAASPSLEIFRTVQGPEQRALALQTALLRAGGWTGDLQRSFQPNFFCDSVLRS